MTHIQKHSQSKKRVCAACGYIYIFAVCERDKISNHKSQAIQLKIRYKKSVEVQINEEEVGGGGK